jgi:hypothetical protein
MNKTQWLEDEIKRFSRMKISELEKELSQLEADVQTIKSQLRAARVQHELGACTDRGWAKKANNARRSKGLLLQEIRKEIGRRSKERILRLDRHFYTAAKEMLPEEVFQRIEKVAMEEAVAENIRRERERQSKTDHKQEEETP